MLNRTDGKVNLSHARHTTVTQLDSDMEYAADMIRYFRSVRNDRAMNVWQDAFNALWNAAETAELATEEECY